MKMLERLNLVEFDRIISTLSRINILEKGGKDMGFLDKILGLMKKSAPDNSLLKEAQMRDIQFINSPSYQANEKMEGAANEVQKEILNKNFNRPYSQDGQDAFTTPDTDTFRIRDGMGQDVSFDSGREPMENDERSAASRNGREDVGEMRDDLAEREDAQFFNLGGNGLRDHSVGYGRENIANGYPNPLENQGNQGNGFDPNSNGGMGQ
jgi:hypothetical protein